MSEYTPTMDEIKGWYAGAVDEYRCDTGMSMDEAEVAFDRWLAAHDADTREQCAREIEKFRDTTKAGCVPRPESDLAGYYMRSGTIDGLDLAARLIREGGQK
jgi:hypothetical protein